MNDQIDFSTFGKQFSEKIFQGMLTDTQWAAQMVEVMRPNFFDVEYLRYLCERYFAYYEKYKSFPTLGLLVTLVRDELAETSDHILRDQVVDYLIRMKANPNPGDVGYVKDKSLQFCKQQAFKQALEKAIDLIQGDNFDKVMELMKGAMAVGMPHSTGHDFFKDFEARFQKQSRNVVSTGFKQLDDKLIFNGGVGRGELACCIAATGVGKSHWLVAMGAAALRQGKNVVHYTFELTETAVGIRYDSNLVGVPSNDVQDHKETVMKVYASKDFGRLIIKEYPTGSASVMTLRNHIEKLSLKGFKPDLVIVDYADIMRAAGKSYEDLRHELKMVYEELRNLAMELQLPIWTASQSNRSGAVADIVGTENMSESYGKAHVADILISISRKADEKASGAGRLFVAKNRAGRDGVIFPLSIDTSMSMFEILSEQSLTLDEIAKQKNSSSKALLREKFEEVMRAHKENA